MVTIVDWPEDRQEQIQDFLQRVHILLITGDYTFKQSEKNTQFNKKYNLRDKEKIEILESLTATDCIDIRDNDNPRYPDSTVYIFIKDTNLLFYGEPQRVELYIKEYAASASVQDEVIVISFHEEGLHD